MHPVAHPSVVIVIPCFNEGNRLDLEAYRVSLRSNKHLKLVLVNDGSTDQTSERLDDLQSMFSGQIEILSLAVNKGKAEAIRAGVLYALKSETNFESIGYIDADLAASIDEYLSLANYLSMNNYCQMVFGARVLMVGTNISRNSYRHYIGRIVATIVSKTLRLSVYDTQCGAKVFTRDLAKFVFKESFISKWLFDVEIFARILGEEKKYGEKVMKEIPLNNWVDKGGSKVSSLYFFRMFYDLFKISKRYPALKKRV
jgi:dolichyl-phosphate beta-glucosyltransferase